MAPKTKKTNWIVIGSLINLVVTSYSKFATDFLVLFKNEFLFVDLEGEFSYLHW